MRRRDPDELTDRERGVLELLRRDFTNEQIAQRLGISVDGAKYHVSQILSKLGVSSRVEAAAVALAGQRPWWLRIAVWARIGGAATVTAAIAGLAVLAWGVVETEDSGSEGAPPSEPVRVALTTFPVQGAGMEPTFVDGTLVDVHSYEESEPRRGDIIVFRSTGDVAVNGTVLDEPYAKQPTECSPSCSVTIPAASTTESKAACGSDACYFVLGDNRPNSSDSRMGWLVPAENVVGWVPQPVSPTP